MEWERLISDYLDDALTPEEVAALFDWIHGHPDNARQFASAVFLHRRLELRLSAMRLLEEGAGLTDPGSHRLPPTGVTSQATSPGDEEQTSPPSFASAPAARRAKPGTSPTLRRFWGLAAVILLVVAASSFLAWPRGSHARLVATENATWGTGVTPPQQGDRFPNSALVLDSGLITLGFDNGNRLTIEGPARFSITDAHDITLDRGALTARVTEAGRGLSVSTHAARVTDLGTEFGVRVSATTTRVTVFNGKVSVDTRSAGAAPLVLSAGNAVEVSAAGISPILFEPTVLKREMPTDVRSLDLVDLIAGGDGTGSALGRGIDAATGRSGETSAVSARRGEHQYLSVKDNQFLDGCFIPDARIQVDSAGHFYMFPPTSLSSYGLIWAGPDIPLKGDRKADLPIATTLPQDADTPTSRVLVMHSNNGITLNLDAVRARHPQLKITGFRARIGNSFRPPEPGYKPATPLASVHVIVDGVVRAEKLAFANFDPLIDAACALSDNNHFLTLATTDGGDGTSCDWVLWTRPELLTRDAGQ